MTKKKQPKLDKGVEKVLDFADIIPELVRVEMEARRKREAHRVK